MSENPGANPNPPESSDRLGLPTTFKRSFDEVALDYEDEDTRSRGSSSSNVNASHGHSAERTKRARSESEREAPGSSTIGSSSTVTDDDVDMSDSAGRPAAPSSARTGPADDLTPALAHIASASSSTLSTTTALPPATTRVAELVDDSPSDESFRLSMERYTAFDSNISALRNNGSSARSVTSGERVLERNIAAPPTSAGSSRPEAIPPAEEPRENRGLHTGRDVPAFQIPALQTRLPPPSRYTSDGRDEARRAVETLATETGLFIDTSNGESQLPARAPTSHVGRSSDRHTIDLFSRARREAEDHPDFVGRARAPRRGPRTLLHPSHSLRSRSVGERSTAYPTPIPVQDDAVFLRDAIATLRERDAGPSPAARDEGHEARARHEDVRASTSSTPLASFHQSIQRERDRLLSGERSGRDVGRSEADTHRRDETRAASPAEWFGPHAPTVHVADPLPPYIYPWYYTPPNPYTYPRYPVPYPYYPPGYSPYYATYGPENWPYPPVPPPPIPPPVHPPHIPIEVYIGSRPPSTTGTTTDRSAHGATTSNTATADPVPGSSSEAYRHDSLSPWFGHGPLPSTPREVAAHADWSDDEFDVEPQWITYEPGMFSRIIQQERAAAAAATAALASETAASPTLPARLDPPVREPPRSPQIISPLHDALPMVPSPRPSTAGSDLNELQGLLLQSHAIFRRLMGSPRTTARHRELIEQTINQHRNLILTLREREATRTDEVSTDGPTSATTGQASAVASATHDGARAAVPVTADETHASAPGTSSEVPETHSMEVDSSPPALDATPETSSMVWDEIHSALGWPPGARRADNSGRLSAASWRERYAALSAASRERDRNPAAPVISSRLDSVSSAQARATDPPPYQPIATTVSVTTSPDSRISVRWPSAPAHDAAGRPPAPPTTANSERPAQSAQGSGEPSSPMSAAYWASVLNTPNIRRPGESTPVPALSRNTATESGPGTDNSHREVLTEFSSLLRGSNSPAGNSDREERIVDLNATAAVPSRPPTLVNPHAHDPSGPTPEALRNAQARWDALWEARRMAIGEAQRTASASRSVERSSPLVAGGTGPSRETNPFAARLPQPTNAESVSRPATTQDLSAMAVDSTNTAAAPFPSARTPQPSQTDRPAARANATPSSERGTTTLEGVGTRSPSSRPRNPTFPNRSNGINISAFTDGPFRDTLARTMAFQSRRGIQVPPSSRTPTHPGRPAPPAAPESIQRAASTTGSSTLGLEPASSTPSASRLPVLPSRYLDQVQARPSSGTTNAGAPRTEVQNDNRTRLEELNRYREDRLRRARASSWTYVDLERQGPWEHVSPWDPHRTRPLGREHESNPRSDLYGYPSPSRGGPPRTRRIRDEPTLYDWPHASAGVGDTYEEWFGLQSFITTGRMGAGVSRGTPESVVNNLPSGTYGEWATPGESEDRCPICFDDDPPPPTPTEIPYATLRTPPTAGAFPLLPRFDRVHPWASPVAPRTTGADATATAATNPNAGLGVNPSTSASTQNNGSPRSDTATINSTNSRTANNNADTTNPNASGPRNPSEPWNGDEYRNPWE
ncbi:hypothetical protein EIP86_000189 [Pleurotus ostreatoroseus]|nr:hypothetical protein EIP86_000189 [Pleurotus ostreatoroseus]